MVWEFFIMVCEYVFFIIFMDEIDFIGFFCVEGFLGGDLEV